MKISVMIFHARETADELGRANDLPTEWIRKSFHFDLKKHSGKLSCLFNKLTLLLCCIQ